MPTNKTATKKIDHRRRHHHWRVTIRYADNGIFGRVYINRNKAERFAARQEKSPVVEGTLVELVS